ncbi:putative NodB-like protein [Seiridium unicorne]|uniref:NodB-like protein n=1 Tax=Seiridium unicorne TaxID=138068 RepID=A0ABR2UH26_9PEZI
MYIPSLLPSFPLMSPLAKALSGNEIPPIPAESNSTTNSTVSHPQSRSLEKVITSCTRSGTVALTYDDGPGPYTDELLNILDQNRVKATFFVNGDNANGPITEGRLPAILRRAYAKGHHIGSHTYSHANLAALGPGERWQEMDRLQQVLGDIIGVAPTYMRPPYFSCPGDCVQDMSDFGFHVVNANLDTKDYEHDYAQSRNIFSTMLDSYSPSTASFIVLVHDIHPETVETFTQYMIDEARAYGYKLVTLGECLGDAKANWYHQVTATGGGNNSISSRS